MFNAIMIKLWTAFLFIALAVTTNGVLAIPLRDNAIAARLYVPPTVMGHRFSPDRSSYTSQGYRYPKVYDDHRDYTAKTHY
ncbi:hypothetical protein D9756_008936 [Leucocoprinus leucothites]|uniref:Secreted protein n=1 Tax=Leucocoprinus leucothites TaxID=201217 RepID=A0A8H5CY28_9AGAR|nr:hypothetical protein D9756_008936 [Leucoagaricus leucothites]